MTGRDAVFCGDVREQGAGPFLLAAHPLKAVLPQLLGFFSSLLDVTMLEALLFTAQVFQQGVETNDARAAPYEQASTAALSCSQAV